MKKLRLSLFLIFRGLLAKRGKSWYHICDYADPIPARGVFEIKKEVYRFSVVVPIYNVEDYLEETVDSVLAQTIGFEKYIQLILVNDGSPDNSEAICLRYKEQYLEALRGTARLP